MKKIFKIIFIIIVVGAIAGYIYWQQNKKRIIRETIESAIQKKTDSLYYIHYDSSRIDEIGGNASFYNVSLQSDSAQKKILESTDSLPNALYFITVSEVRASGIDVAGLIQNTNVAAGKIVLYKPRIQVINTGADKPKPFTAQDTMELYKKILGKFSSIKADTIQVSNGTVIVTDRAGKPLTTLENINIDLKHFLVDNTHSYENIISYFIKDVSASIENIQLPESKNNTRINMTKLAYDAAKKILQIKEIQQYRTNSTEPLIDLKNINITQLNTDAFIVNQQLKAGMITCDGGLITLYKKKKIAEGTNKKDVPLATDFVDEAQIGGMNLGTTKIVIINEENPAAEPFILNDVKFSMTKAVNVYEGNTLSDIITNADWKLTSSGFSFITKNKLYRIVTNGVEIDNVGSSMTFNKIAVVPLLSEAEFVRQSTHQRDRFDLVFNNIKLTGVNYKRLIGDGALEAEEASLQPIIKVMNDRTVDPDPTSKVGNYPNQLLMGMQQPIYIKKITINNGLVAYKERGRLSEMTGIVNFTNLNGAVTNVTNIPERLSSNSIMKVTASTKFLGEANLTTTWLLPLTKGNGNFTVTADIGTMNALTLNRITEPLGMVSVKSGKINKTNFTLHGDDYKATGDILFTYNDLKIQLLKKGEGDELKKKTVTSFLANFLIRNDNPSSGKEARKNDMDNNRELNKSFFNLIWKTVFVGLKKTASGKTN
jgi:hypothetical protein